jgi:uncharacterized membrane protein YcfT
MIRYFAHDERGAVTVDWVALTAGLLILGIVVVYAVMNNATGQIMDDFDTLNVEIDSLAERVSALAPITMWQDNTNN